jgi:hypothetical protein
MTLGATLRGGADDDAGSSDDSEGDELSGLGEVHAASFTQAHCPRLAAMLPLALRANVPTVHGLEFAYSLYPLPPGRLPFKRWRWELWHGAHLIAAGWRFSRPDAGRALRLYAAEHGHKLFGLVAPPRDERAARGDLPPGTTERIAIGSITAMLVPRGLVPAAL